MGDQRCETCRFRHRLLTIGPDGLLSGSAEGMSEQEWEARYDEGSGECRRNPPSTRGVGDDLGRFPEVMLFMWCGEYQPAAAPVPEPAKAVDIPPDFMTFAHGLDTPIFALLCGSQRRGIRIDSWDLLFVYQYATEIPGIGPIRARRLIKAIVAAGVTLPESWRETL